MPRGNKCGCICPSCKTPLIARQGSQKEWHFAHQSKNPQSQTKNTCEYSFAVSVRLMIHQLVTGELKFHTPKLTLSLKGYSDQFCKRNGVDLTVTEKRQIVLTNPEIDAKFSGTSVDILGDVEGVPFAVYIKHKNRLVPHELDPPTISKCGVVAIDISGLHVHFEREKGGRYMDVLRKFIEEGSEGKSWIYHPRFSQVRMQADAKIKHWLSEQEVKPQKQWIAPPRDTSFPRKKTKSKTLKPLERKVQNYQCIMCNAHWRDISPHCKNCDSHLYAKIVNGNEST